MFSRLVYCSDCGEKLYYGATNNYRTEGAFFDCFLHCKHKDKCGTHYIREKVLQQLVLQHIQMVTGYIYRHEAHFRQVMEQQLHAERAKQIVANCKALERSEKRITELKRLFIKIYEDNASGKLSDERFDMMSQTYEAEQKELEAEVIRLQKEIEVQETQIQNIESFIQKAGQHVGIEELTPYVLHELIKAIYVDAPDKSSGKRRQHIHIQYDKYDHGFVDLCTGKNVVVDIDSFISLNNHSDKLSSRELAALLYACSDHQPLQETLETKALSFLFNVTSGFSSEYFCPDSSIIQINESEELSDKLAQTPGFKQLVSWTIASEFDHYKKDLDFTVQEDATVDFCVTSLGTCIALSD